MKDPSNIHDALEDATRRLEALSDSARLDAELLLARAIDMPRSYLFAHPEELLDELAVGRFREALDRRLAGEPMADTVASSSRDGGLSSLSLDMASG